MSTITTYLILLEPSKVETFLGSLQFSNLVFLRINSNPSFADAVQMSNFKDFYTVKNNGKVCFAAIKTSQSKFYELEKSIKKVGGAIESIEWQSKESINLLPGLKSIKADLNAKSKTDNSPKLANLIFTNNSWIYIFFFACLIAVIFHDILAGFVIILYGLLSLISKRKSNTQKFTTLIGGFVVLLVGILGNNFMGSFGISRLNFGPVNWFSLLSNFQLFDLQNSFSNTQSTSLLNQLVDLSKYTNYQILGFLGLGLGLFFNLIFYVIESAVFWKNGKKHESVLRMIWLILLLTFVGTGIFVWNTLQINPIIFIPVTLLILLLLVRQKGNKIKHFLISRFGILEYIKLIFKVLPYLFIVGFGYGMFWLVNQINIFGDIFFRAGNSFWLVVGGLSLVYAIIVYMLMLISGPIVKKIIEWTLSPYYTISNLGGE